MNDIQILQARSIWLFDITALNPSGVAVQPMHDALRERYQFLQYPNRPEDFAKTEISYQNGAFSGIGVNLFLYPDGIIADTRSSTETSDAFLNDVLVWARDNFKLRYDPLIVKTKAYESQIVFNSDVAVSKGLARLGKFAKILDELGTGETASPQDVVGIMFRNDKAARHSFTFERRDNTPFSERKYFSRAAFGTKQHLQLIGQFEKLLKQ
jgi:hypothetical protein